MKPVLLVTTEVPPDRVGAFRALAALIPLELALFGGGLHATAGVRDHGLTAHEIDEREIHALAAGGRYGAVIAGTAGRIALPGAWLGAERARIPFLLWTALWAHPRSAQHLPGALLLRLLYRRSAEVITYGEHVSRLARACGARRVTIAPQAVDQSFWTAERTAPAEQPPRFVFVGRDAPGKGLPTLLAAWERSGLAASGGQLELVGPEPTSADPAGVLRRGLQPAEAVRSALRGAAALVIASERTATFREPWGLVANEAMHARTPVIATTDVGAVAGGLVRPDVTGLVTPSGDAAALANALTRASSWTQPEREAITAAAFDAATPFTHEAWAAAVASAVDRSLACPA